MHPSTIISIGRKRFLLLPLRKSLIVARELGKTWENSRNRFPAPVYALTQYTAGEPGKNLPAGSNTVQGTPRRA